MLTLTLDRDSLLLLCYCCTVAGLVCLLVAALVLWAGHDERTARVRRPQPRPPGDCENPFCDRR